MAYCDVDALKFYLDIGTSTENILLQIAIEAAKSAIDNYTGRTFEADVDRTRYFSPETSVFDLSLRLDYDLCSITSIVNADGVTLEPAVYVTEPRNAAPYHSIRLKRDGTVTTLWRSNNVLDAEVAITGRWAYSLTAPDSIIQAATRLAAWFYRQKDNANDADRAILVGNATLLPSRLPTDVIELLKPYKRVTL